MASELRALVQPERRDLRKAFSPEKLSYSIAKEKKKKKKSRSVKRKGDFLTEKQRLCPEFPAPGEPKGYVRTRETVKVILPFFFFMV